MLDRLKAWLRERRRRRLERAARELDGLLRDARRYARYDGFVRSVLAYRHRKGFITPKQHRALKGAVRRAYWTSEGA